MAISTYSRYTSETEEVRKVKKRISLSDAENALPLRTTVDLAKVTMCKTLEDDCGWNDVMVEDMLSHFSIRETWLSVGANPTIHATAASELLQIFHENGGAAGIREWYEENRKRGTKWMIS